MSDWEFKRLSGHNAKFENAVGDIITLDPKQLEQHFNVVVAHSEKRHQADAVKKAADMLVAVGADKKHGVQFDENRVLQRILSNP